jgi:hypothetical protein
MLAWGHCGRNVGEGQTNGRTEAIVKKGPGRAIALLLIVCLMVACVVDTDGDPLTQDFPNVVLILPTASAEPTTGEQADGEAEQQRAGRVERAITVHRAAHRWKAILERWHRSFLGDPPV